MHADNNVKGTAICLECGKTTKLNRKIHKTNDKNESKNQNATYAAMKHFDSSFKNILVGQQEPIENAVLNQIRGFMFRDRKLKVNIDDIR